MSGESFFYSLIFFFVLGLRLYFLPSLSGPVFRGLAAERADVWFSSYKKVCVMGCGQMRRSSRVMGSFSAFGIQFITSPHECKLC